MGNAAIAEGLKLVFAGIAHLKVAFPDRAFTIDGRLVGDVGEVIAALEYEIELHKVSKPGHDATTLSGRNVQIKATFQNSLTFRTVPDYYSGFKLYPDGSHEEIFNGPGRVIAERYIAKKGFGISLISIPIARLRSLSAQVQPEERILKRARQMGQQRGADGDGTLCVQQG